MISEQRDHGLSVVGAGIGAQPSLVSLDGMKTKRAVLFGAGNIGRGFVGWLLSRSGYEVCFVARNEKQISLLRNEKEYTVTLANEKRDSSSVQNVTAIHIQDDPRMEQYIASADLITTAVGAAALPDIAVSIAKGLEKRLKLHQAPLHIIACENAVGGSTLLKKWVYSYLPKELHAIADETVAFPDTILDRIVPAQTLDPEDPLKITVEPFFEWVIQRSALKKGFPGIEGVRLADSLEPYVERKLFTVNTGHCCAAYYGYEAGYSTIQEVMKDSQLRSKVERVLEETSQLLIAKHGFDAAEQRAYVQKTLQRFANPAIKDKVLRVARSPLRKLAASERLVRPAIQASRLGMEVPHLASAIATALTFRHESDLESVIMQISIGQKGVGHVIRKHMAIPDTHPLHAQITEGYKRLREGKKL